MKKVAVGILGATGAVGQRFVQLLTDHPWFEVTHLYASEKSAGRSYEQAVNWKVSAEIPAVMRRLIVNLCDPDLQNSPRVVFSALDSSVAGDIEERFAKRGFVVISNSSNHRMDADVPLLIPEVNPDHLDLLKLQKKKSGTSGCIITNPNCTTVGLAMVLKPLHDAFGVTKVIVTSMQALSGAGYPGVSSLDAIDNVVPYIKNEEEKIETEPLKLLGRVCPDGIINALFVIDADCNRVGVRDGHMESVTIEFEKKPSVNEVIQALRDFRALPQELGLPSAPNYPIVYREEADRPQPVLDRDIGRGMSVVVGRVRKSAIFDIKLTLLVHNTIRGAAGAAILNAELMKVKGLL